MQSKPKTAHASQIHTSRCATTGNLATPRCDSFARHCSTSHFVTSPDVTMPCIVNLELPMPCRSYPQQSATRSTPRFTSPNTTAQLGRDQHAPINTERRKLGTTHALHFQSRQHKTQHCIAQRCSTTPVRVNLETARAKLFCSTPHQTVRNATRSDLVRARQCYAAQNRATRHTTRPDQAT